MRQRAWYEPEIYGLTFDMLDHELFPTREGENPEKPPVYGIQLKMSPHLSYLRDYFDNFKWEDHWIYLPWHCFSMFTTDELCRLLWSGCIMSDVSEEFEKNWRYRILHKVRNGLWKWGITDDYNYFVKCYNSLSRFDFGLPDFTVLLDHTTWYNDYGKGQYSEVYLDGTYGYLVHYKGEHVMTIGFSLGVDGLMLCQVQLKEKKGNRWLYKLPKHYMEYVVDRMMLAYSDFPFWYVSGKSLAKRTIHSYGKNADRFTPAMEDHIVRTYDRPLAGYRRREHMLRRCGLEFFQLTPARGSVETAA